MSRKAPKSLFDSLGKGGLLGYPFPILDAATPRRLSSPSLQRGNRTDTPHDPQRGTEPTGRQHGNVETWQDARFERGVRFPPPLPPSLLLFSPPPFTCCRCPCCWSQGWRRTRRHPPVQRIHSIALAFAIRRCLTGDTSRPAFRQSFFRSCQDVLCHAVPFEAEVPVSVSR